MPTSPHSSPSPPDFGRVKVLFVVEGNTDIRFVTGLASVCDLTLLVPQRHYEGSGLDVRVAESGATLRVVRIPGGRAAYQARSFAWLLRYASRFQVLLTQELLRGTLNASLAGRLHRVPVLAHILIPPLEYFACRRARGQNPLTAALGRAVIRTLLALNGRLVTRCLAWGPYLQTVARRSCRHVEPGHYYGIDTHLFRPASESERAELRARHHLPHDAFLALAASRVSHEKDPESALRGAALARSLGLNLVLLNLGGGYREFLDLARQLGLPDCERWVIGRPAQHPMRELADFFRCADAIVQASLEEGLALSTLEGLAAGTPVIASQVGGMAVALPGLARLVPRRDPNAIARELLWIASHPTEARTQALQGRAWVEHSFRRDLAFEDWRRQFERAAKV
ncbi:MAG: glycosyltransferase [Verrucomicrobiales bacterium]|nr:glycosyltransferase [Verrucomicrobiales bacterium]